MTRVYATALGLSKMLIRETPYMLTAGRIYLTQPLLYSCCIMGLSYAPAISMTQTSGTPSRREMHGSVGQSSHHGICYCTACHGDVYQMFGSCACAMPPNRRNQKTIALPDGAQMAPDGASSLVSWVQERIVALNYQPRSLL